MMNVAMQLIQNSTDMDIHLVRIVYEYSGFSSLIRAIDTIYEECYEGSKCALCFYDTRTTTCDSCVDNICDDCIRNCSVCMSNVCIECIFESDCKNCRALKKKIDKEYTNISDKNAIILMRRYIYNFRNENCRLHYDTKLIEQLNHEINFGSSLYIWSDHFAKCPADYNFIEYTNIDKCSHCSRCLFCDGCIKKKCKHCYSKICLACSEIECRDVNRTEVVFR
jgi:hypothetical protein